MKRNYINEITKKEGEDVVLAGWVDVRRDHGKLVFIDLRDKTGKAQLVFSPKNKEAHDAIQEARNEWVIRVKGKVQRRPENMRNPDIETGDFEVPAEELEVLNKAETLPFPVDTDGYEIAEELRLKHRYLDLRRPRMKNALELKQKYKTEVSKFLQAKGFTHVDTPILTKSTPEGARDFIVPSRNYPGKFYALPQSPQQYKQLLMVAGVEKYFQFARCFRDEDLRQDRLLELEQLDMEMSFVEQEDILNLTEELVIFVSEEVLGKKIQEKPFPRLTYKQAMKEHGTDAPDLRKDKKDKETLAYCWVVDFPMFEEHEDGSVGPTHHPFTAIQENDINKLSSKNKSDLLSINAQQYDLSLNGHEVFGGSIREHRPDVLTEVFEALGYERDYIEKQFGHLLEAFSYGVPPHGGIAASDRWLMAMLGEKSIREVVSFPTTGSGQTAVMDAPSKVDEEQLKELGIKVIKKKKKNK